MIVAAPGQLDAEIFECRLGEAADALRLRGFERAATLAARRGSACGVARRSPRWRCARLRPSGDTAPGGAAPRCARDARGGRACNSAATPSWVSELSSAMAGDPGRERLAGQLMLALSVPAARGSAGRLSADACPTSPSGSALGREGPRRPPAADLGARSRSRACGRRRDVGGGAGRRRWSRRGPVARRGLGDAAGARAAARRSSGARTIVAPSAASWRARTFGWSPCVGPGGVGKTRLALAVAHEMERSYPGMVGWTELASVGRAADVAETLARAVGVARQPGRRRATPCGGSCRCGGRCW